MDNESNVLPFRTSILGLGSDVAYDIQTPWSFRRELNLEAAFCRFYLTQKEIYNRSVYSYGLVW
jgi:hypothetical protein